MGFKVNSERAVQFRKWVNTISSEYTIKGWVMDDARLKQQGAYLTDKYFEEQPERVREIRAGERRFYQKITDIYATAVDYDRFLPELEAISKEAPPSINNPFPQPSQTKPPSVKDGGFFLAGVSPPTYLLCRRQIVV